MGELHIISKDARSFSDRRQAAVELADILREYALGDAVVLGIPRGGVVIAREIADRLKIDMDVILTRKIGAPNNPELAIGAVTEAGTVFINNEVARYVGAGQPYIEQHRLEAMAELARRSRLYRSVHPQVSPAGRTVIITDDGVATGATLQAAMWAIRQDQPKRLVVALPVGPEDTVARLALDADDLICLKAPPFFHAVGQFYESFPQLSDDEVIDLLSHQGQGSHS